MEAAVERARMVEEQIWARGIRNPDVLAAMQVVPRECFIDEAYRPYAYDDTALPIQADQTISQPYVVALMIDALRLGRDDQVLEVGAGSGYATAVLSRIARQVFAIERIEGLADFARQRLMELGYDNVHVRHGDGTLGWPEHAPYDGILVSAGGPDVPPALRQQLAMGGRLVIPVGTHRGNQRLIRLTRRGEDDFAREKLGRVRFVPLIGEEGWEDVKRET